MDRGDEARRDRAKKPVRCAVSVVVAPPEFAGTGNRVLAVRRPPDDPDLPDLWGLPAAGVRPGESLHEAARRAGVEKLGVRLGALRPRASGATEREGYRLEMQLFDARIVEGSPSVPQPVEGVTQYSEWRWAEPTLLAPAAARGSLCCRLFFESGGGEAHA